MAILEFHGTGANQVLVHPNEFTSSKMLETGNLFTQVHSTDDVTSFFTQLWENDNMSQLISLLLFPLHQLVIVKFYCVEYEIDKSMSNQWHSKTLKSFHGNVNAVFFQLHLKMKSYKLHLQSKASFFLYFFTFVYFCWIVKIGNFSWNRIFLFGIC